MPNVHYLNVKHTAFSFTDCYVII